MWFFFFASNTCRHKHSGCFIHVLENAFLKMQYIKSTYFKCMHVFCVYFDEQINKLWPPASLKLPIPGADH